MEIAPRPSDPEGSVAVRRRFYPTRIILIHSHKEPRANFMLITNTCKPLLLWYSKFMPIKKYYKPKSQKLFICLSCEKNFWCNRRRKFCNDCSPSINNLSGRDYNRHLVRIRDNNICQKCKRVWRFGERKFDIHHLEGLCGMKSRGYDSSKDLSKLITLCHKCHLNLPEIIYKMKNKLSPRLEKIEMGKNNV